MAQATTIARVKAREFEYADGGGLAVGIHQEEKY